MADLRTIDFDKMGFVPYHRCPECDRLTPSLIMDAEVHMGWYRMRVRQVVVTELFLCCCDWGVITVLGEDADG